MKLKSQLILDADRLQRPATRRKRASPVEYALIFLMAILVAVSTAMIWIVLVAPTFDVLHRESQMSSQITQITNETHGITLTQLLNQYEIPIQTRTSFGETQVIVTIDPQHTTLDVLLEITSQLQGVFSMQYTQDSFQIFIAGGSV